MAFHFALAAVLRVRESMERREQMALDQCYRQLYSIQKQLAEADARLSRLRSGYESSLAGGTRAGELQCLAGERARIEGRRVEILKQLAEGQQRLRQQLERYRTARRQREVVTELRRSARREWIRNEAVREQRFADDLFLLRRQHGK